MSEQKTVGLSEEDEDMIDTIIRDLKFLGSDIVNVSPAYKEEIDWLKSLPMRCPKSSDNWKPSEEQMEAFKKYIEESQARAEAAVGGWNNFDVMIQLYEQLKKHQN